MIIRALMFFVAVFAVAVCERSFFVFLPGWLQYIEPVLIIGLLLIHFTDSWTGTLWLVIGGLLMDVLGPVSIPLTITLSLCAFLGVVLSRWVFTNRSLYAMMGLGSVVFIGKTIFQALWLTIADLPIRWTMFLNMGAVFLISLLAASFISYGIVRFLESRFILRAP